MWLGDSIGRFEGDTLVVETRNFRSQTGLYGGDENLYLIERFTPLNNGDLLYNFTVDDPTIWTEKWSGEYVWKLEAGQQGLRVRLPRRQLRHGQHPARRSPAGKGSPGSRKRMIPERRGKTATR